MRKKVLKGWVRDGATCYDYDSGREIKGIKRKDEALKDFEFSPDILPDRIVLRVPLISPTKKFWSRCGMRSYQVKVTMERCR